MSNKQLLAYTLHTRIFVYVDCICTLCSAHLFIHQIQFEERMQVRLNCSVFHILDAWISELFLKSKMPLSYLIVAVIVNSIVVGKQYNVNAFLMDPSKSNHNLNDFLASSDFVSFLSLSNQLKFPKFGDFSPKLNNLKLNSTVHELCGMNTVSCLTEIETVSAFQF